MVLTSTFAIRIHAPLVHHQIAGLVASLLLSARAPAIFRAMHQINGMSLLINRAVVELASRNHRMVAWTLVGHVFGLVLWIAGLLMTTVVLIQHSQETSSEARQTLSRMGRICLRGLADPGALLTLLAGIVLVTTNRSYYLHARWLHIKLVFVVVLMAVHGIVAMRNKSLVSGRANFQPSHAKILFVAILLVFLLILISTLPGEASLT